MINYSIERELGAVGDNGKQLRLVAWGDNPAKLDLRPWWQTNGQEKPGKGITLTSAEAQELVDVLENYLSETKD